MFESCFLLLTWSVDPAAIERRPVATCVRPTARVAKPEDVYALLESRTSETEQIANLLKRWERSTADQPEWSRSMQEEFRRTIVREFNEHAAAATLQFIGPVRSDQLSKMFDWTVVAQTDADLTLEAIPHDEMDRLFFRSIRVLLIMDVGTPRQILVIGRNQRQQLVWKSEGNDDHGRVQFVNFEDKIPPTPNPVVRTADARFE